MVVNNTGVYASAGVEGDGVEVLRGVGSIIRSMVQFAADDDVDDTLHDIQAALAVADHNLSSLTAEDANWENALHLQYENAHAMLDYGLYGGESGDLDTLTFKTDVGWPKLFIRQCYNHDGAIDTSKKTNLREQDLTNLFSGTVYRPGGKPARRQPDHFKVCGSSARPEDARCIPGLYLPIY